MLLTHLIVQMVLALGTAIRCCSGVGLRIVRPNQRMFSAYPPSKFSAPEGLQRNGRILILDDAPVVPPKY